MPASLADLAPYVCRLTAGGLADVRHLRVVSLVVDICGFTALAESLSDAPRGVERLSEMIDRCFEPVVEAVQEAGGAILTFPGDAAIALWPADGGGGAAVAVHRAAACAAGLLDRLAAVASRVGADPRLGFSAGLALGDVRLGGVGGERDRAELLCVGSSLARMGLAERLAQPGEVVLGAAAAAALGRRGVVVPLDDGFCRLASVEACPAGPGVAPLRASGSEVLRPFLPRSLLGRLDAGQTALLAEIRPVSVVFVRIAPASALDDLHFETARAAVRAAQIGLYAYEGALDKVLADDKGLTLLGAFGLPPLTHEDDAERSVLAALEIARRLRGLGLDVSVGVARGPVYVGPIGGRRRRSFTLVGSAINRAARLMSAARGGVLCDASVAVERSEHLTFQPRSVDLRGIGQAQQAWVPEPRPERVSPLTRRGRGSSAPRTRLVGRQSERDQLEVWAAAAVAAGRPRSLLLVGEAGSGKTFLVERLVERAPQSGLRACFARADPLQRQWAHHPWIGALAALHGGEGAPSAGAIRDAVLDAARELPRGRLLSPLLDELLGGAAPLEEAEVGALGPEDRRHGLIALLADLVEATARALRADGRGLLVVFEDAHWADEGSRAVCERLARATDAGLPLALVVTARRHQDPDTDAWLDRLRADGAVEQALTPFESPALEDLICQRTGARVVAPTVIRTVAALARGNPFFSDELTRAYQAIGRFVVHDGVCRLGSEGDARGPIPETVGDVIRVRLDRVSPAALVTLKTASVLGDDISLGALEGIHPGGADRETLARHLDELGRLRLLTPVEGPAGWPRLRLRHAITGEVVYGLMLERERQLLHERAALWYGEGGGEVEAGRDERAFFHWCQSGREEQAVRYVEAVGQRALRQGSYQAAAEAFEYGLRALPADAPGDRARWSTLLAEALVALGEHDRARPHLEVALAHVGHPMPRGSLATAWAVGRELVVQVLHRVAPGRFIGRGRARAEALERCTHLYKQLGYIHYAASDMLGGGHDALQMLNRSEEAGPSGMLARAYAAMELILSVLPWRWAADAYGRQARRLAARLDPATAVEVEWIGLLRALGEARFERMDDVGERALRTAAAGALTLHWVALGQVLAAASCFRGGLVRAEELASEQLSAARSLGHRLWEGWALNGVAEVLLARGAVQEAEARARAALSLLADSVDVTDELRARGLLISALSRQRRDADAWQVAVSTWPLLRRTQPTSVWMGAAFVGVVEAAVGRLVSGSGDRREAARLARLALRRMRDFVRIFPLYAAHHHVARAHLARAEGRHAAAQRDTLRARHRARQMGLTEPALLPDP